MRERRDHGSNADTGEDAKRGAGEDDENISVERHVKHDFDQRCGKEDHQEQEEEERGDFGNDDFVRAGGRH